jgi:hypothetical protein
MKEGPSFESSRNTKWKRRVLVEVLISLWLFLFPIFLFAAHPKTFFLDGLKKLEQRSHKCVEFRGGRYME